MCSVISSKCDHFSSCTVLAEATWNTMDAVGKTEWNCQHSKHRNNSPNIKYYEFVYPDPQNQQNNGQDEEHNLRKKVRVS